MARVIHSQRNDDFLGACWGAYPGPGIGGAPGTAPAHIQERADRMVAARIQEEADHMAVVHIQEGAYIASEVAQTADLAAVVAPVQTVDLDRSS